MPLSAQILESLPDGVIIVDEGGIIRSANGAAAALFGYSGSGLAGLEIAALMPPAEGARHQAYIEDYLAGGTPRLVGQGPRELAGRRRDGSPVALEVSINELCWGDSRCFVAVVRDLAPRRRAREEARINREFFAQLFNSAPVGISVSDRQGRYVMVNRALCEMVRYSETELLGRGCSDIVHPDDLEANRAGHEAVRDGEVRTFRMEKRYRRQDGEVIWVLVVVSPVTDGAGQVAYTIAQMLEIDQLKRAEQELTESRRRLRALAVHQEAMLEAERKHVAREVHDELGQLLTALRMDVALLRMRFGDIPELREAVGGMRQLVDRTLNVVREVASNLRPAALDLGIVAGLEWLVEDFGRRWGIRCHLRVSPEDLRLGDALTLAVFRVAQESLTNVARHAFAQRVDIRLERHGAEVRLEIRDDGVGFDVAAAQTGGGFGLMSMRERMVPLLGCLDVSSQPGAGTRIVIAIPLDDDDAHPHPDR